MWAVASLCLWRKNKMKRIVILLIAVCAICTVAVADVTISDWGISPNSRSKPIVYEGLIDDIGPAGFEVHASPGIWGETKQNYPVIWNDGDSPWLGFQSNNVSPGLMINYDDTYSFAVSITGFDNYVFSRRESVPQDAYGDPIDSRNRIRVNFLSTDDMWLWYETPWTGDDVYEFGRGQIINYKPQTSDFEVSLASFYIFTTTTTNIDDCYHFADNTQGTVEFAFPASVEVPEPSGLLALAFGGAGTAMFAIRKRK